MSPDFCDFCVASDSILRLITDLAKYIAFGEAAMSFHEQSNLMSPFKSPLTPLPGSRDNPPLPKKKKKKPKHSHMGAFNHSFPLVMTLV